MIVLITTSERAGECAKLLAAELKEKAVCCRSIGEGRRLLRTSESSVVVLDQLLAETDEDELERLVAEVTSPLVIVNLAISAPKRVAGQVRAAIRRARQERAAIERRVVTEFRSDLNSTVTGILLASQLALSAPGLPEAAEEKLRSVFRLAKDLRAHLRG
jgi:hypothetical protein